MKVFFLFGVKRGVGVKQQHYNITNTYMHKINLKKGGYLLWLVVLNSKIITFDHATSDTMVHQMQFIVLFFVIQQVVQ